MTVKKLREELAKYPDHMEVFLGERKTEFRYEPVDSVRKARINFMEEPDGDPLASDDAIILDEPS